jgi:hypothetical protein
MQRGPAVSAWGALLARKSALRQGWRGLRVNWNPPALKRPHPHLMANSSLDHDTTTGRLGQEAALENRPHDLEPSVHQVAAMVEDHRAHPLQDPSGWRSFTSTTVTTYRPGVPPKRPK